MAENLSLRPAATVMTLRDRPDGYEILMLRRNLKSDFVGGAYVFPGGAVDDGDGGSLGKRLAFGRSDVEASERLNIEHGGLAYYVAGLRELFEEAGLLVACDDRGDSVRCNDDEAIRRMAAQRRAVNNGEIGFIEMMEREGLYLDLRGLEYIAHWVTPIGPPRRFDTRFFVALAPEGQIATHDAGETIADQWIRPLDALAAHGRGEFELVFPTIKNLEAIANFATSNDVLDYAKSLLEVPRTEPRIIAVDDEKRAVLPGDDGYDD